MSLLFPRILERMFCRKPLLLAFIIIFAAGVTCSVVCPEREIVSTKLQESGPCTDCTSTDFIATAKISNERVLLNATLSLDPESFMTLLPFAPFSSGIPESSCQMSPVLHSLQPGASFAFRSGLSITSSDFDIVSDRQRRCVGSIFLSLLSYKP